MDQDPLSSPEDARALAEKAVARAQSLAWLRLDFSPTSLDEVGRLLPKLPVAQGSGEGLTEAATLFGCYLGEVIIRNYGGAWWRNELPQFGDVPETARVPLVVRLPSGIPCNPLGAALTLVRGNRTEGWSSFYRRVTSGELEAWDRAPLLSFQSCNLGVHQDAPPAPSAEEDDDEDFPAPAGAGLTPAEAQALRHFLRKAGARGPDDLGCYAMEFPGGGHALVVAKNLQGPAPCLGVSVQAIPLGPHLAQLLFDLCQVGNLFLLKAWGRPLAVVTSEAQRRTVEEQLPPVEVMVGRSAVELQRLLAERFWVE